MSICPLPLNYLSKNLVYLAAVTQTTNSTTYIWIALLLLFRFCFSLWKITTSSWILQCSWCFWLTTKNCSKLIDSSTFLEIIRLKNFQSVPMSILEHLYVRRDAVSGYKTNSGGLCNDLGYFVRCKNCQKKSNDVFRFIAEPWNAKFQ